MKQSTKGFVRCGLLIALTAWFVLPAVPQGEDAETGMASWYGIPYHGHYAASGEIFDMDGMTAAHPTLPFNTRVRVVNLGNDRSVEVRINDRGPFVGGRIIDLSRAAARSIGLIDTGTGRVRVEVVGSVAMELPPPIVSAPLPGMERVALLPAPQTIKLGNPPEARFVVQTGAFRNPDNADRYAAQMRARYGSARIILHPGNPDLWRVVVGAATSREGAEILSARIRQESGENNAFLLRLDTSDESERPGQSTRPRGPIVADGLHTPIDR
ncbi:MAG TPA: septal ring lytic transglycosylase RlpA family protein [Bryobacteraceae bacterium]